MIDAPLTATLPVFLALQVVLPASRFASARIVTAYVPLPVAPANFPVLGPEHHIGAGAAVQREVAGAAALAGHGRLRLALGLHGALSSEVADRGHEGVRDRLRVPVVA